MTFLRLTTSAALFLVSVLYALTLVVMIDGVVYP